MDLRCELCVPGGVLAGCVDAAGVLHDATPQHFMQAQVRSSRLGNPYSSTQQQLPAVKHLCCMTFVAAIRCK